MPLRALLYRRPSEPPAISIVFDREIYLVRVRRHRQARRYTLRIHSVTREVVLTMPPRGSLKQAREFAEKHGGWIAARLDRLPAAGALRARRACCRCAASITASCIGGQRAARCGSRPARRASACSASPARRRISPRRVRDFLKREAKRDLEAASRRAAARARRHDQARVDPRPVEPLGLVLDHRRAVLFVAADPGAALRARLSRRPRGRASRRDEPLARVLAAGRAHLSARRRAPRPGSTRTAPTCIATGCRTTTR